MPRLTDLRDILDHLDDVLKQARSVEGVFRSVGEADTFGQRVTHLRAALEKASTVEPSFALIAGAAFPGLEGESLRVSYSRFAALLSQIAKKSGTRFALVKPSGRNRTPAELLCHFEGDSLSDHRLSHATSLDIESVSRDSIAASGPNTYIPMRAWPDEPLVFVSFAVAETDLVDRFMRQLIANLKPRCRHRVKFWRFDEVTAESGIQLGDENEAEIRKAMDKCQFGLLLISPTYIGRPFIERVELPHFIGPDAKAPFVPVALADWTPGEDKDLRLDPKNVFSLKGKPYNQLRSAKQKADFTKELAELIEAFIDHRKTKAGAAEPKETTAAAPAFDYEKARRDALDLVPDEYEEQAKDWRDLDGRSEEHLGRVPTPAPDATDDASRDGAVDLMTRLSEWAASGTETPAYLGLLGETGAGKTMSCLEFTRRLLADGKSDPLVIYLDLRRANEDGLIKRNERPLLAEIIEAIRRRTGSGHHASVDELLRAVRERRAILIWDGLDEVLVHLSHEAGQAFFRQLLEALPPRLADAPGAGRLVFACRTQYFRDLHHEADLFTGGQKEGIPTDGRSSKEKPSRARFEVLRVLPFSEEQIRGYLAANVPGIDVDRAFEVIETVHNLRELAGRPYLLSLMRESLADFDTELAAGRTVHSVDLYERLVNRWLEREKTREVIGRPHKRRLMQRLAAHFWREGIRSIPVEDLDAWLEKLVVTDPLFTAAMGQQWSSGSDARDALCEHLRAATFLGRWDGGTFRFAHTSLLEYFLACHLVEALEEGRHDDWELPRLSPETISFAIERTAVRRHSNPSAGQRIDTTLGRLLGESRPGRSENALGYYLRLHAVGELDFTPAALDFRDLDLTASEFTGSDRSPLPLPKADFTGATLIRAVFRNVDLKESLWICTDLRSAEFLNCKMESTDFSTRSNQVTRLEGVRLRACELSGSVIDNALIDGLQVENPKWDKATEEQWQKLIYAQQIDQTSNPSLIPPDLDFRLHSKRDITERNHQEAVWSFGHNLSLYSVATTPNGKLIVSAGDDRIVRLWNVDLGRCLLNLEGHESFVVSAAITDDGSRIVTGSADNTVRVWDVKQKACVAILKGHTKMILSVAISSDGSHLVSGGKDNTVRIWNLDKYSCIHVLEDHEDYVWSVGISRDGKLVASGSVDKTVRLWNATNGKCLHILSGHTERVTCVSISEDSTQIVSGSADKTIRTWDSIFGVSNLTIHGHICNVDTVRFSPDKSRIASGSGDKSVRIWDARTGKCLQELNGHFDRISTVVFSKQGEQIVSSSGDSTFRIWDLEKNVCIRIFEKYQSAILCVAYSRCGTYIVSGGTDNTVRIWDATSGQCVQCLFGHQGPVLTVAFSPNCDLAVSGSDDGTFRIWNIHTGESIGLFKGRNGPVQAVTFLSDGRHIASAAMGTMHIWDSKTGVCVKEIFPDSFELWNLLNLIDDFEVFRQLLPIKELIQFEKLRTFTLEELERLEIKKSVIWTRQHIRISSLGTLRQTLPGNQGERDIAALPDGGYCVLEKKPGGPWRIARAKGEYWRYVNYASDTRPDGTPGRVLYSADLFPPAIIDE